VLFKKEKGKEPPAEVTQGNNEDYPNHQYLTSWDDKNRKNGRDKKRKNGEEGKSTRGT